MSLYDPDNPQHLAYLDQAKRAMARYNSNTMSIRQLSDQRLAKLAVEALAAGCDATFDALWRESVRRHFVPTTTTTLNKEPLQ